jgi:hypothetical protein
VLQVRTLYVLRHNFLTRFDKVDVDCATSDGLSDIDAAAESVSRQRNDPEAAETEHDSGPEHSDHSIVME